ncbi:hypothetical protein CLOM_g5070 [Closterium sp. NIES-68]|nr:hypothetical protein CLOM_g5070 [Closterium sp. NIES-68]GJP64524.1 hypothetical protein CLOP_g21500 [Closterium sp. NIES-67]
MAPTFTTLQIEIPQDDDRSSSSSSAALDSSSSDSSIDDSSFSEIDGSDGATAEFDATNLPNGRIPVDRHIRTASGSVTWMPPSPVAVKSPHASAIRKKAAMANGRATAMECAWAEAEEDAKPIVAAACAAAAAAAPGDSSMSTSRSQARSPTLFGFRVPSHETKAAPSFPLQKPSRVPARTSSGGIAAGVSPRGLTRTWSISTLPSIWRKPPHGEWPKDVAAADSATHAFVQGGDGAAMLRPSQKPRPRQSRQRGELARSLTTDSAVLSGFNADDRRSKGRPARQAEQGPAREAKPAQSSHTIRNQLCGGGRALVRTASAPVAARTPPSLPRRGLELGRDGRCQMAEAGRQSSAARSCVVAQAVAEEGEEEEEVPVAHAATAASIGALEGGTKPRCFPHAWTHAVHVKPLYRQAHSLPAISIQSPPVQSYTPLQRHASLQPRPQQQQQGRACLPPSPCADVHPSQRLPAASTPPAAHPSSPALELGASTVPPFTPTPCVCHASPRVFIPRLASSPCACSSRDSSFPTPHPSALRPSATSPSLASPCLLPSPSLALPSPRPASALPSCLRSPASPSPHSKQARRVAFSPVVRVRTYSHSDEDWPAPPEHTTAAVAAAAAAAGGTVGGAAAGEGGRSKNIPDNNTDSTLLQPHLEAEGFASKAPKGECIPRQQVSLQAC